MIQPIVTCQGIQKLFGTGPEAVQALRGIDVAINQGEFFMVVGPSGCGKTTLISIIAGIMNQSHGECSVLGENVSLLSSSAKVKFRAKNIGFVFQSFNLLPSLTAAENVAIPLFILGESKKPALAKAHDLLAQVGLKDRGNALPSKLSGGQQQRIAIARALIHRPKIVVCDEPTSALDHETGAKVMEMMKSLSKEHGTTLIIVTHDNRIFHYADRIGKMDDGCITAIRAPETTIGRTHD